MKLPPLKPGALADLADFVVSRDRVTTLRVVGHDARSACEATIVPAQVSKDSPRITKQFLFKQAVRMIFNLRELPITKKRRPVTFSYRNMWRREFPSTIRDSYPF